MNTSHIPDCVLSTCKVVVPPKAFISDLSFYGQCLFIVFTLLQHSLPLFLAHYSSLTWPHLASALTPAGGPMTVPKAPRHQHNGISKGSTPCNTTSNNISWVCTSTSSGFKDLDNLIIAALPAVELCMIGGEQHFKAIYDTSH